MNPLQSVMTAIIIVRELRQLFEAFREIPEEELVKIVATNLVKIRATVDLAKKEMAQYA